MSPSAPTRPANLLDQRHAHSRSPAPFELRCSQLLDAHGIYLSDLPPEAFVHICDYLRSEAPREPG